MKITYFLKNFFSSENNHSEPVLINFKKEMNCYNFPHEKIASADDIAKRLSLFKHIMLTAESVSLFRDQIIEYRSNVAKASGKKEIAGVGAMMIAADGAKFDSDALSAIKEIRVFCKKYGSDFPNSTIRINDFYALGICVASSIALQKMEKDGFGEFNAMSKEINSETGREEIKNKFREYMFNTSDWIED